MKKQLLAAIAAFSLAAIPTLTFAQDTAEMEEVVKPKTPKDWFVYGDVNIASGQFSETDGNTTYVSDSFKAAYFRAGVKYKYFGLEGEIGTGLSGIDEDGVTLDIGTQKSFFGILRLPNENYDIFLRGGYHSTDFELSDSVNEATIVSDGFAFGVGGTYYFTDNFGLRADVTGYNTRDLVDAGYVTGSIGASVKF